VDGGLRRAGAGATVLVTIRVAIAAPPGAWRRCRECGTYAPAAGA